VIDMGCGIGFFSLGLARIVGAAGHVLAIDR
jgi:ubiquinone/menaquinone biosynthesis C-methylase UbiE